MEIQSLPGKQRCPQNEPAARKCMSDDDIFFVDSNLLLHSVDPLETAKRESAK